MHIDISKDGRLWKSAFDSYMAYLEVVEVMDSTKFI